MREASFSYSMSTKSLFPLLVNTVGSRTKGLPDSSQQKGHTKLNKKGILSHKRHFKT